LEYHPAPADNPLRGLVPYAGQGGPAAFPHSLEFHYFPLSAFMKDWDTYEWKPLDELPSSVKSRGNQTIFRVYCEYPGKGNEIPKFLQDAGVKVVEWHAEKNMGGEVGTPDYKNPLMRREFDEGGWGLRNGRHSQSVVRSAPNYGRLFSRERRTRMSRIS